MAQMAPLPDGISRPSRPALKRQQKALLVILLAAAAYSLFLAALAPTPLGFPHYLPLHAALTRSPFFMVRDSGCRALARYSAEPDRTRAIQVLETCLHDGSYWVRWAAVDTLVELNASESAGAVRGLVSDPDSPARMAARDALAQWRDPFMMEYLLSLLQSRTATTFDLQYADLLGYYHDPRVLPTLTVLLASDNLLAARSAVTGLARLDTPAAWHLVEEESTRTDIVGDEAKEVLASRAREAQPR